MNKKELRKAIIELPVDCSGLRPKIDQLTTLKLIKLLDEPEKVKVSEEEAKFLKTFDFRYDFDVTTALYYVSRTGWGYHLTDKDGTELKHLTREARLPKNRKRLIKAILGGYEVEKEKQYLVKFKGLNRRYIILKYDKYDKTWFLGGELEFDFHRTHHTRKQLEKSGFGWVFDCEGIEIEEVEG